MLNFPIEQSSILTKWHWILRPDLIKLTRETSLCMDEERDRERGRKARWASLRYLNMGESCEVEKWRGRFFIGINHRGHFKNSQRFPKVCKDTCVLLCIMLRHTHTHRHTHSKMHTHIHRHTHTHTQNVRTLAPMHSHTHLQPTASQRSPYNKKMYYIFINVLHLNSNKHTIQQCGNPMPLSLSLSLSLCHPCSNKSRWQWIQ